MSIATMPATAKLDHIRTLLQRSRKSAKRDGLMDIVKAIEFLDDIEKELRK